MNDVFEKIGKTISEAGQAVGEKTKGVIDIAKLSCRIGTLEQSLTQSFADLGKEYYEKNKENPDENEAEAFNEITAAIATIKEMKEQLATIKGVIECPVCGTENAFENNFCGKCGAKLEKPEPVAKQEATEEVKEEKSEETTEDKNDIDENK